MDYKYRIVIDNIQDFYYWYGRFGMDKIAWGRYMYAAGLASGFNLRNRKDIDLLFERMGNCK